MFRFIPEESDAPPYEERDNVVADEILLVLDIELFLLF